MIRTSQQIKQTKEVRDLAVERTTFSSVTSGVIKRAFDILVALVALFLLSPVFLFIAILIKRDSPGPVFYWGVRIGRNGVTFKMLKFRTMYEEPKSYDGPRVTCKEDERITPLGKWLRDTKLNELPQFWNVLVGDMSLVGPRPEDPTISKTWPVSVARELLSVRPGITSPASILYRDEEAMLPARDVMRKYLLELSPDKMRLDQLYIRYRSFWLDLDVILWTAILLLPKIRSYSPPEPMLFVGPVSRLFQRYVSWFLLDFLIVLAAIGLTGLGVRLYVPLNLGLSAAVKMALGFALLYSGLGALLKNNVINWPKASSWESGSLSLTWLAATAITLGFHYYQFGFTNLRTFGVILVSSILALVGFTFVRYRGRIVNGLVSRLASLRFDARVPRERVLIVGSGRTAEHIAWLMEHPTYSSKFHIVGFIDDDLLSQGMKIYGAKVIGRVADVRRIAKEQDVGLIILADNQMALQRHSEFRDVDSFAPARVMVAPDLFGSLNTLNVATQQDQSTGSLSDFQCQYCIARLSHQRGESPTVPTVAQEETTAWQPHR